MKKITYKVKGEQSVTACPWGRTNFAGAAKMVGTLGCMNCVYHGGQSYTESGGVVSCLAPEGEKRNGANGNHRSNRADGSNGRTKRVAKKNNSNNKKTKKEEKV